MIHVVITTNSNILIPEIYGAMTRGFFIFIRPEHKENYALIEHEKVHVKQFWRSFCLHAFRYKFSKEYRLRCEVEAFKRQLEYLRNDNNQRKYFAKYLSENYDLDITFGEAFILLGE